MTGYQGPTGLMRLVRCRGRGQLTEMRSPSGLVASELGRDGGIELVLGPQVWTPDGLLLSCVVSQHRGLVRTVAYSGTL